MPRPQFRLRSLFILTAIVAAGCWLGLSDDSALAFGTLVFCLALAQAGIGAIDRAAPPKN